MSIKLMLRIITILAICIYIFKKTVSGDAENDYRLRDILANSDKDDEELTTEKPSLNLNSGYNEKALSENVYEELEKEQTSNVQVVEKTQEKSEFNNYSTQTHETQNYSSDVYYEKINDDACDVENFDEDNSYIDKTDNLNTYDKEEYNLKPNKNNTSKSLLGYIKSFWRGVTFTTGLLFSLYAIYGFTFLIQDTNDSIVYSIWLLAGVILLK